MRPSPPATLGQAATTSERDALLLARALTGDCREALGKRLLAVLLHGSLVMSDFSPSSDVDILVIVERRLGSSAVRRLQELVLRRQERARLAVDLRVVTKAAAACPSKAPAMEFSVRARAPRSPDISVHVHERDLLAEFSVAQSVGQSLLGPEPAMLIGVVPDTWLVEYGDQQLAHWQQLTNDETRAELMVLTACRVWRYAVEQVHCSKGDAGRWALVRDPSLDAIEAALRRRRGDADIRIESSDVAAVLSRVRAELKLLVSRKR